MSEEAKGLITILTEILDGDRYDADVSTDEILWCILDTMKGYRGDLVLEAITGE